MILGVRCIRRSHRNKKCRKVAAYPRAAPALCANHWQVEPEPRVKLEPVKPCRRPIDPYELHYLVATLEKALSRKAKLPLQKLPRSRVIGEALHYIIGRIDLLLDEDSRR